MDTSIYVATAAQRTLQRQLVTIANNVANANTIGFRAESVEFKSLVSRTGNEPVNYPTLNAVHPSSVHGSLINTGNPLDIALSGEGWFAISTPAGTAYTRDGRMQINAFGELNTLEGHSILDSNESPLLLPTNSGPPKIFKDGRIEVNGSVVGNIGIFSVAEKDLTQRFSNSAFFSTQPGIAVAPGGSTMIQQNFLESSNVNPMQELANMIMVSRSFESATSIVESADKSITKAVNQLAEV